MQKALKVVGEKFNVKFNIGNQRYSETNFRVKVECDILEASGKIKQNPYDVDRGLPIVGKEYIIGNHINKFKVEVVKNRRKKSEVNVLEMINGTRFNVGDSILVRFTAFSKEN